MALVGAQHVVCLVDCHADMFAANRDGDGDGYASSSIDMTLQLIDELLQQRIRTTVTMKTGKRDGVGVILYHTKPNRSERSAKQDQDHHDDDDDDDDDDDNEDEGSTVHVLLPLTPPGSSTVRTIRACFQKDPVHGGRLRDLQQEFAFKKNNDDTDTPLRISPLQTALEECLRTFQNSKCVKQQQHTAAAGSSSAPSAVSAVDTKTIWIFSNRDNSYPGQSHLIQNVARDVQEHGIQIITWPLLHPQQQQQDDDSVTFRHDPLLESISTSIPFVNRLTTQDECLDALEALQQYWKKLRRSFCCPLLLPGAANDNENGNHASSSIYVDWFRFVQMAKKPNRVPINQQTKRYVT